MESRNIEQLTAAQLSEKFGGSRRWWTSKLALLYKQGTISKRGKLFFGDMSKVADWLMTGSTK